MAPPTLEQKLKWLRLEPATEYERRCTEKLSPGDYEVGFQRSMDILDEAWEIFMRLARSYFGIAGDSIVAMFTAQGDLANSSCGTFLHSVIQPIIIKYILHNYAENIGIRDGDIWFTNDAVYGGIHNPDKVIVIPVFYEGNLIAWTGAACHTTETGACEPGGMPISAKSRYDEGFCMPPTKIGENGVIREDFLETYAEYGSRAPDMVLADLRARATAADRIRRRLVEECDKYGVDYVVGLLRKMVDVAAEGARRVISCLPDGKYRCVNFNDGVGIHEGLVRSAYLTVTKEDDKLTIDFTGTSPENLSPYNAHTQAVIGHMANYMFEYVFHSLPASSAVFMPIGFIFPPNICLNPARDAATSNSVMICSGVMSAVHSVFGKMVFPSQEMWRQVVASHSNAGNAYVLAGINQFGHPFSQMLAYTLNTEGHGGRLIGDGGNAEGFCWCLYGRAPSVEAMENEMPVFVPISQHAMDTCGHGKYRGGAGTFQMMVVHRTPMAAFLSIADNSNLQTPQGLFGGYAPACCPGMHVRNSNLMKMLGEGDSSVDLDLYPFVKNRTGGGDWENEFHCKQATMYNEGDIVNFGWSTGGAGYGDPLERDPESVVKDVIDRIISDWTAEHVYKVVYDKETHIIDYEATERLRSEERNLRLQRGKPYEEFEKEWSKLRPPEEILSDYGSWPDAKAVRPVVRM